jgi:glycosyltransferase involved in cell wall biosynthesis
MRIARILTRLNLGGPARQALGSDPLLQERGHELRLFVGKPQRGEGDLFDAFVARGLDVVRVAGLQRGLNPARDLVARRQLARELAAFGPDVVHTHASKAGALGRSVLRGQRFETTARVHTFHGHVLEGYFPAPVSRRLVTLERKLARDTDRILAVSHATADDLVRLGVTDEDRLVVVPPGIDMANMLTIERPRTRPGALRELVGADTEDVLVGVIGRLAEVKQPERAVALFQLLGRKYPRLQLVFLGDGELRGSLERRIRALDADGQRRVHLAGAVQEMEPALADLDAVLLTSRSEGLPVALIEAAAAGLPVVATEVGGVGELVVHERTGFLGQTDTELAFGLAQLLENPEERRAMGERARLRIGRRHGADVLAGRLEEVYRVVVAERRGVGTKGAGQ